MSVIGRVDDEVLRGFTAGDDAAFAQVYRRYCGPMFAIALATVGRRDLAADVVQQAFIQAWRAAASYSAESDIAPWLFTITRRAAIDLWRRERRHVLAADDCQAVDEAVPGPCIDAAWEAWQVRQALDELPAAEREVVHLAYVEDLTQEQTADRLGIPVGTVKSRSHRAHHRLRELLSHLLDQPRSEAGR
jgi:RNA polymerase sigma-70 factor (ECF subfamily)